MREGERKREDRTQVTGSEGQRGERPFARPKCLDELSPVAAGEREGGLGHYDCTWGLHADFSDENRKTTFLVWEA